MMAIRAVGFVQEETNWSMKEKTLYAEPDIYICGEGTTGVQQGKDEVIVVLMGKKNIWTPALHYSKDKFWIDCRSNCER